MAPVEKVPPPKLNAELLGSALVDPSTNVPAVSVVVPEYVLPVPLKIVLPEPVELMVIPPVPLMAPLHVLSDVPF